MEGAGRDFFAHPDKNMRNAVGFLLKKPVGYLAGLWLMAAPVAAVADQSAVDDAAQSGRQSEVPAKIGSAATGQTPTAPGFVVDWGSGSDSGQQITNAWKTDPANGDGAEPSTKASGEDGRAAAPDTGTINVSGMLQPVRSSAQNGLPKILSDEDVTLYKDIFRFQEAGNWRRADKLITNLSDPLLKGHVLYQRYLHPRAYRAKYQELLDWMQKYRDHPGAERVYKLALKRRPKNWRYPPRPIRVAYAVEVSSRTPDAAKQDYYRLSRWKRNYVRRTQRHIRIYVRRGQPTRALRRLTSKKSERIFDKTSMDESSVDVAHGFYNAGKDEKALELAGAAAERSGRILPLAHWWAGLAAWRLGNHSLAAEHFTAMTKAEMRSDWSKAAAAFWAARAYLVNRQPEKVNLYLTEAAQYPDTFYGLLAIRTLGLEPKYNWALPKIKRHAWKELTDTGYGKRAMALLQVGQESLANRELKRHTANMSEEDARLLVALGTHHNMPSLALRVGRLLRDRHGSHLHAALYPLPEWKPQNGYTIDKALVFAVMRQESRFMTRAKSHAGARGLMQLMPGTASFISGHRYRGHRRKQLFDPELNIAIAQKYVHHLLQDPNIDGDLFYAVAAYNGGPGNLRKWQRRTDYKDDPLLFIESIPLKETRNYVERVLTNLWIYRYRFEQSAPSLDAIAAGEWPSYTPLDGQGENLAARESRGL